MELKDIDYVLAIAKYQSISRAARELFISQPALTKYQQNLEQRAGIQLFDRVGKKLIPTAAGERYIVYATEVAESRHRWELELKNIIHTQNTQLKMAFSSNGSKRILPAAISELRQKMPALNITVSEYPSTVVEDMLQSQKVDLGFITLPVTRPDIDYEVVMEEYVILAVPLSNPLSALGTKVEGCPYPWVDLRRFANEPFIIQNPDTRFRAYADRLFKQYNISPKVVLTTQSKLTALEFSEYGEGLCFISDSFIHHVRGSNRLRFFAVGEPIEKSVVCAAFRRGSQISPPVKELIHIFKELHENHMPKEK